jgi:hypothetical protein
MDKKPLNRGLTLYELKIKLIIAVLHNYVLLLLIPFVYITSFKRSSDYDDTFSPACLEYYVLSVINFMRVLVIVTHKLHKLLRQSRMILLTFTVCLLISVCFVLTETTRMLNLIPCGLTILFQGDDGCLSWCCSVVWYKFTDVSEVLASYIIRAIYK